MSDLLKAYSVLGVEPGCSKETIQTRYKRMVVAWHPDRFPTDEGKADAEEEMKKILNARDLLLKHFENSEHRSQRCECYGKAAATGGALPEQGKQPQSSPPQAAPRPQPQAPGNPKPPPPTAAPSKPRPRDAYDELDAVLAREQREKQVRQQETLVNSYIKQKAEQQAAAAKPKRQTSSNFWLQLFADWKMALLSPVEFFKEMPPAGGFGEPFALVCILAFSNGLGTLLFGISYPLHAVERALIALIVLSVGSFAWAYVTFRLSKGLSGGGDFEASYRACAYAMAPLLLLWIPFVGIICYLYSLFLLYLALETAHELKPRSCSLVVFIDAILAALLVTALALSGVLNGLSG
ncbi:MAG TPA: YIP1 family protein [Candidatus Obscuribacterales bacterium]